MLKNSARNSKRICSRTGNILKNDRSQFWNPGPRTMFRPAFPNVNGVVLSTKAQVLKMVPGMHGFELGLLTTFGRTSKYLTPPPPSLEETLVTASVTVNQLPVEAVVMPANCQFPMIWFFRPVA